MPIQKIKSGRIITVTADAYVGDQGTIFYDEGIGKLRLSNGRTPGGIPIAADASNIAIDGGSPTSNYGGTEPINGGEI
jgi:hypothetical protein